MIFGLSACAFSTLSGKFGSRLPALAFILFAAIVDAATYLYYLFWTPSANTQWSVIPAYILAGGMQGIWKSQSIGNGDISTFIYIIQQNLTPVQTSSCSSYSSPDLFWYLGCGLRGMVVLVDTGNLLAICDKSARLRRDQDCHSADTTCDFRGRIRWVAARLAELYHYTCLIRQI